MLRRPLFWGALAAIILLWGWSTTLYAPPPTVVPPKPAPTRTAEPCPFLDRPDLSQDGIHESCDEWSDARDEWERERLDAAIATDIADAQYVDQYDEPDFCDANICRGE
jgi:hypothetical protein